jgi:hypothetical protein
MQEVIFAIDLRTIMRPQKEAGLKMSIQYYQALGIDIPKTVRRYSDLFQLPEVMRTHEATPGAVEGIRQLKQIGIVRYYAVFPLLSSLQEAVLKQWLSEKGFDLHILTFCLSERHKLFSLYEHTQKIQEEIILIDKQYDLFCDLLNRIALKSSNIADHLQLHLTIACFGRSRISSKYLRTVPFRDWSHIADLPSIHRMEKRNV